MPSVCVILFNSASFSVCLSETLFPLAPLPVSHSVSISLPLSSFLGVPVSVSASHCPTPVSLTCFLLLYTPHLGVGVASA